MKRLVIPFLLLLGVIARFWAASWGHTYDMESYEIVAKIVLSGGNVYAETTRYNYGPFWSLILAVCYWIGQLFSNPFIFFRYEIATLLTTVDIGIFYFLKRHFSLRVGFLYFLNPISILVTGYYSQFDGIALLLGLMAARMYEKDKHKGLIVLGTSLIFKHVFFLFPVWIAVREHRMRDKIISIVLPLGIFFACFIPFVKEGFLGIINNVFFYLSFNNAPLWHVFMPDTLKLYINQYIFFLIPLIAGAFYFRKKPLLIAIAFYAATLVLFSLAISEQYFIYILPFLSIYFNPFFFAFTLVQTLFMFLMVAGGERYISFLRMLIDRTNFGFNLQMILLLVGVLYGVLVHRFRKFSGKQWILLFIGAHVAFFVLYKIPDSLENQKVILIQHAISLGDYEKANALYGIVEKNPPFAGSRFWNKLSRCRYYIEYYRNYRKAKTISDKYQIQLLLKGEPPDFLYREDVKEMLESKL